MRNLMFFGILCVVLTGCGRKEPDTSGDSVNPTPPNEAVEKVPPASAPAVSVTVQLQPTQGNHASGTLQLATVEGGVRVTGQVSGLEPNSTHGMHIHEKGDCSAPDAKSAGDHFAPMQHPHGPPGPDTHVGDLGNIQADAQGVAQVDVKAVLASLGTGAATDVTGKAVIVHAKQDDLTTQPSGDSGDRIACGVIP